MMKYLLVAAAAAAIAAPAAARDGSAYVGIEGGLLFPSDTRVDLRADGADLGETFRINYKRGFDADLIAGYDFGMVRAEAELGWKRAKIESVIFDGEEFDADDENERARVLSLMGNVLLDLGGNAGWGAYVGGGFGRARVKVADARDSAWAWQLLAGVRTALSSNVDLGLKYRYFNTGRLSFEADDEEFDPDFRARGRFRSHSVLASLIFNFGGTAPAAPPPPPPPPPPPGPAGPQTRTCPDGTVVLAMDPCPLPPAPPPPPMPLPERG